MLRGNSAASASAGNLTPLLVTPVVPVTSSVVGGYFVSGVALDGTDASTGYTVGDILTIAGGTKTLAAQAKVDTVDGNGAILTLEVQTAGDYSVKPSDPESVTGGTGTGAKLDLTWSDVSGTYFAKITYVFSFGEQNVSPETSQVVAAGHELKVTAPASVTFASGWNLYLSTGSGTETRQNGSTPLAFGADYQMTSAGLVTGAALPATVTVDLSAGLNWLISMNGNITLAKPTNLTSGKTIRVWFTQDGTGSRLVTYDGAWKAAGGASTLALSTTVSVTDVVTATAQNTNILSASIMKNVS